MALVPFPDSTAVVARAAAVALIRSALGLGLAVDVDENADDADDADGNARGDDGNATALRLGQVSSALVGRYDNCWDTGSRRTPDAVLDEAVLRLASWLNDTPAANVQALSVGRAVSFKFDSTARNALRNSGAMDLLSAYRQHGAGVL